jgi:hypothetical protein
LRPMWKENGCRPLKSRAQKRTSRTYQFSGEGKCFAKSFRSPYSENGFSKCWPVARPEQRNDTLRPVAGPCFRTVRLLVLEAKALIV